jgi:hypothetical protein
MLSRAHSFVYLHVPKTGGNSIQTLLLPFSDDRVVIRGHQDGRDRFEIEGDVTPKKHAFLSDYASALGQDLERFQIVISIRHPVDRAISFYFSPHRWFRRSSEANEWQLESPHWSLDAFEDCLKEIVPMVDFVRVDGELIRPNHTIRFENLVGDCGRCASLLGLDTANLPHVNRSTSNQLAQEAVCDPAVGELIARHFAEDFVFFGYPMR